MIKLLTAILLLTCLFARGQTKRVLFLGNSGTFVNDLPQITADIANVMGDTLLYDANTPGGYTLQEHAADAVSLSKITEGNWDFIVLQGSNLPSLQIERVEVEVFPYVQFLDSVINVYNPCGETMLYMTWGMKNGDAANCPEWEPVCTYEGMDDLLRLRYRMMADSNRAVVSPVGAVWRYIRQHYPSIELFVSDNIHTSQAGSYAAACTFYTGFFRKDPLLITYDFNLEPTVAANIRTATKRVMYDSLLYWHIGEYDLVSDFDYTQLSGFTYQFNSHSQNQIGQIWDFGIEIDTFVNPTFTFPDSGTYLVQLSSFNLCDTIVSKQLISVSDFPTGLKVNNPELPVMYPNPAGNNVFLNLNSSFRTSVNIYNAQGKNVMVIDHLSENEIDVRNLKSGVYLLEIKRGKDVSRKKLVIQK